MRNLKFGWSNNLFIGMSLVFGLLCHSSNGQSGINLGNTNKLLTEAIGVMEKGEYAQANSFFREIINSNVPIPPEMPYHFAVTLFHLKQYDNSANFIKKYLDLNGFKGEHFQKAKELESALEMPLMEIKACNLCNPQGYRYATCETCNGEKHTEQPCSLCKGKGIIGCSRCVGDGLVTKINVFNITEYFECDRCLGKGRLTCTKCEGSLIEFGDCTVCAGKGFVQSETLCDHLENNGFTL
ncbi:MAG: molecular chaperone DnaJ [Cyclobacteriaceae bacterium]